MRGGGVSRRAPALVKDDHVYTNMVWLGLNSKSFRPTQTMFKGFLVIVEKTIILSPGLSNNDDGNDDDMNEHNDTNDNNNDDNNDINEHNNDDNNNHIIIMMMIIIIIVIVVTIHILTVFFSQVQVCWLSHKEVA